MLGILRPERLAGDRCAVGLDQPEILAVGIEREIGVELFGWILAVLVGSEDH